MAASVIRFPGGGCLHYVQGRCLRSETINPGFQKDFLCRELTRLEGQYDDLLRRVDAFDLPESQSLELMQNRLERLRAQNTCPDKVSAPPGETSHTGEGDALDCIHARGHVCLLQLPLCDGVCRHYASDRPDTGGEEDTRRE